MKRLWAHKALLIQAIKVVSILLLLVLPLAWPNAKAKKPPPPPPSSSPTLTEPVAEAPATKKKKEKKKKKAKPVKEEEPTNQLTQEGNRKLLHYAFTVPPELKPAVDFWKMIYAKYDRRFEVFHDTQDLSLIYSVLDFSDLYTGSLSEAESRAIRRERSQAEKERIRGILERLALGGYSKSELSSEERRIYELFQNDPNPNKFLQATDSGRLRSQTGIQDKFMTGLSASGEYLEEIEEIFNRQGVPVEITRLVFVESMFNTRARSKVGASGIWQFMPGTGKLYLNINSVADERNDPILASHAAARLLRDNYEALGTWPLAINAYNSGRATLNRAVNSLGTTDIATIILNYSGGVYGFASRNFYPCFLAALELANQYPKHFGKLKIKPRLRYEYYYLKNPLYLNQLATRAGVDFGTIAELNPHLAASILYDSRKIPSGYSLRIPNGSTAQFAQAETEISSGRITAVATKAAPNVEKTLVEPNGDLAPENDLSSSGNAMEP